MTRQSFEALFDQARSPNPQNPTDLTTITEAFEKQFDEEELNKRKIARDACARGIVQKLAELPDNVSLVECLAYIQTARSLAAAGNLQATSGLPEEIAKMQHRDNKAVYQAAERLVREQFASCGQTAGGSSAEQPGRNMVKIGSFHVGKDGQMDSVSNTGAVGAKIVGSESPGELRFAGSFQAGELGPTGPGGLPEKLVLPEGFLGGTEIDAGTFHDPERAPEEPTVSRKELIDQMSYVSDKLATPEKEAQFSALCKRHLDQDHMDWMREITTEVINSGLALFTEGNPDDRMNLEACLEFARRNAAIMIPLDALSELPHEVADAYIANNQAVIDACDQAIKERFADLARAAAAQAASTEFTPEGGRVVATSGPIRIEAPSNTITREQFMEIGKERTLPTELLHRVFAVVDRSGKRGINRGRFKKAIEGAGQKIRKDMEKLSGHLDLDHCNRLIKKYETWIVNARKKYLACCDDRLRKEVEQFYRESFDQMRQRARALFKIFEKDSQPPEVSVESGEPTVDHDVLSRIYGDRYDNQLSSAAMPLQLVGEMTSALPDDEGNAIMEAVRQHENATDAVIQGLPAKLTEADCIGAIEIIRNLELTGALAGIKHVVIGDRLRKSVDAACDFMAGQARERFREISPTISSVKLTDFFRRIREQLSDSEKPAADMVQQLMEQLSDEKADAVMVEVETRGQIVNQILSNLPDRITLAECLDRINLLRAVQPTGVLLEVEYTEIREALGAGSRATYDRLEVEVREAFEAQLEAAAERTISKQEFFELTDKARVGHGLDAAEHEQVFKVLAQKVPGFADACTAANAALQAGYDALPDPVNEYHCLEFLKLLEASARPIMDNVDRLPEGLADKMTSVYADNKAALKRAVDDFFQIASAEDGKMTTMPEQVFLQNFTTAMDNCLQEHEQLLERLTNELSTSQADEISQLLNQDINEMVQHCSNDGQAFTEAQCYELLDWMLSRLLKQENTTYKQASSKWKTDWKKHAGRVIDQVTTMTDNWFAGPSIAQESVEISEAGGPVCILKSEFISIWNQEFTPPEGGINAGGLSKDDTKDPNVQKCVETMRLTVKALAQIVEDMPPFITVARFCKFIDAIRGAMVSLDSRAKQVNRPAINEIVAHYQAHLATFRQRMRTRFGMEQESGGLAIGSARFGKSLPDGLQASAEKESEGQIPLLSFNSLFDNCVTASRKAVPPPSMEQLPQGSRAEWESFTLGFKTHSNQCVSNVGDWLDYSQCKKLIRQFRDRCLKVRAVNVMKVVPRKFAKLIDDRQIYAINEVERRLPKLFGESGESAEAEPEFRTSKIALIQLMKQTESEYKSSAITRIQGQLFADADKPVQRQIIAARDKSIGAVEDLRDKLPVLVSLSECNAYLLHHRNNMRLTHFVEGPPLPDEIAQSSDDSENEMLDRIIAKLPALFEKDANESENEPKGTVSIQEFVTLLSSVDADSNKKHAKPLGKAYDRLSPEGQQEAQVVSDSKIAAIQKFRENNWGERLTFAVCKHYCRYAAMGFPPKDFGEKLPSNFCKLLRRIDRDMYRAIEKGLPELFRKHAKAESADTAQAVNLGVSLVSSDEIEALTKPPTISKTEFKRMIAGVAGMADSVMSVPMASDLTEEEKQTHARRTGEELEIVLADYPDDLTEAQCTEMIERLHAATSKILQELSDES